MTPEDPRREFLSAMAAALSRYGAAMYFYARGQMAPDALEVYRICSPIDSEDPRQLLASRGFSQAIQRITSA
jgi:hypothetical protein